MLAGEGGRNFQLDTSPGIKLPMNFCGSLGYRGTNFSSETHEREKNPWKVNIVAISCKVKSPVTTTVGVAEK